MSTTSMRVRFAEKLLFDLAAELRFVPIEERSRSLHLRALELKRTVRAWSEAEGEPAAFDVDAAIEEIGQLTAAAQKERRRLRTGHELARPRMLVGRLDVVSATG